MSLLPLVIALAVVDAVQATATEPPVFPSATEQVLVDVVVQDGSGRPITNLTREDFLVAEDGSGQTVSSFEPPLAATDRDTPAPNAGGVLAIVFDDLGLTFAQASRARKALSAFARSKAAASVAFLATTSGRERWPEAHAEGPTSLAGTMNRLTGRDQRDFGPASMTDVEACLIHVDHDEATLTRVAARYAADGTADALRATTRPLVQAEATATCQRSRDHARRVLDELRRASERLSSWDGRRAVVLVSAGFPRSDALPELRRLLESSRRANVAVHLLDPSSLQGRAPSIGDVEPLLGPADEMRLAGVSAPGPAAANADRDADRTSSEGATPVVEATGGLAVRRTNDLAEGLGRIVADSRARYTLGYVPKRAVADDRYRAITVRLVSGRAAGRRGWTVRARRGYFPTPASSPIVLAAGSEAADAGAADAASNAPAADLPLRLHAECREDLAGEPQRVRCLLAADVDLRSVQLAEEGERRTGRLVATFVVAESEAKERLRIERRVDLGLVPGSRQFRDRWMKIETDVALAPGLHEVSSTVRDEVSGRSGEARLALEVPGAGVLRVSRRRISDAPSGDEAGSSAADDGGSRVFASGSSVFLSFDVFGSGEDTVSGLPAVTVQAVAERRDGGKPLPVRADVHRSGAGGWRAELRVELGNARPGEYRLLGRVMDRRRTRGIAIEEPFSVGPRETATPRAPLDPELASLLDRAGRYVAEYEQAFRNIVADEEYEQRTSTSASGRPDRRRTRADLVFVRLDGPIPWASFRDVYEVDGTAVRNRTGRLQELFARPSRSAFDKAETLLAESTRYNIGLERTVNLPTLPLVFLLPRNRPRFAFSWREKPRAGEPAQVDFRETARPTFVRNRKPDSETEADSRKLDLPADGRFWIDSRGVVVRSDLRLRTGLSDATAELETRYRPEPRLAMWVPEEMKEHYELSGPNIPYSIASHGNEFVLDAIARYTNVRRFQVTTDETVRAPEPAPEP